MKTINIEFGLDTFGDVTVDNAGRPEHHAQVIRNVVEEAVLADQLGIDFFGVGEHHREDFAVSAPEVVLATIAGVTSRIKLGSAVTVLSSDDPIRVFQRFSTLDALSSGRAEVILGRGSFTESFPLFGFSLSDYETLFQEKLDLFSELLQQRPVTWSGTTRAPLSEQNVFPHVEAGHLKTWIGVGGSPNSVIRAAQYSLPLMLAIIGGSAYRFKPYVDLYHEATRKLGFEPLPVGIHSPGYIADSDKQARDEFWPHYRAMRDRIGKERGWGPITMGEYIAEIENGSLYIGSPETVTAKLVPVLRALGAERFQLKYSAGNLPHKNLMQSIRLYGEEVIPAVKAQLASGEAA
ncbi:LLM class flavin-dependent oxidoreductase [Agrobacterium pusense]|jgi:probable LLM family oxidoreductase|uniref:LLM class flavin-dependent oxidoreductase n=1 Tax=Agrobacterium pusense TaxID=648995 RepID=UPI002452EB51|nr:LLM class flavin-dependent oxidoreductase [Agrobacterium pusense]